MSRENLISFPFSITDVIFTIERAFGNLANIATCSLGKLFIARKPCCII